VRHATSALFLFLLQIFHRALPRLWRQALGSLKKYKIVEDLEKLVKKSWVEKIASPLAAVWEEVKKVGEKGDLGAEQVQRHLWSFFGLKNLERSSWTWLAGCAVWMDLTE
jgi:hypothetical protein